MKNQVRTKSKSEVPVAPKLVGRWSQVRELQWLPPKKKKHHKNVFFMHFLLFVEIANISNARESQAVLVFCSEA